MSWAAAFGKVDTDAWVLCGRCRVSRGHPRLFGRCNRRGIRRGLLDNASYVSRRASRLVDLRHRLEINSVVVPRGANGDGSLLARVRCLNICILDAVERLPVAAQLDGPHVRLLSEAEVCETQV